MGRNTLERPSYRLYLNAKSRARNAGVPFTITEADIVIPERCPVLGFPLVRNLGSRGGLDNSPTLDRVVPERGYVKDNIVVVSRLANTIKSSATPDQIRKVYEFYLRLQLSTYDKESK